MKIRHIDVSIIKGDIDKMAHSGVGIAVDHELVQGSKIDEHTVRAACARAIVRAGKENMSSVVLPAFGCDAGFPLIGSAKIISQELLRVGREAKEDAMLKEIVICVPTEEMLKLFEAQVYGYLRHVMQDLGWGPYVTTDIIIEIGGKGIVVIERTNPPFGWALPGGFVDRGETVEEAVVREIREETNLVFKDIKQLKVCSDPQRDPRFHTISVVFVGRGEGRLCAADDAQSARVVDFKNLPAEIAFDHRQIITDYHTSLEAL
jgi:ADP-ribose pyrophosphatase YjhB (NUDIX family)